MSSRYCEQWLEITNILRTAIFNRRHMQDICMLWQPARADTRQRVKKEGYMPLVQHWDTDTCDVTTDHPIILQYVPVSTEIWSDEWPAYQGLSVMETCRQDIDQITLDRQPL